MLVFEERGKPEFPEKNLSEQSREPTNSAHIWRRVRESNPGHIGGRRALSPLHQPCSPKLLLLLFFLKLLFWYVLLLMFIVPSKNYVWKPCWLAQSKRTPPLAGKLQSPLCAGWQYVSFRIFYHAGWLTTVLHDGWLGVLFPETLACWQWRAGNFFPRRVKY